ncbi:P-loop containing nucleoside triphosphate hydrolase protein [Meredithblackwellia eburnea MCA 4105]
MAPRSKSGSSTPKASSKSKTAQTSAITATSQQSRFHSATLDTNNEIDLQDVTIAIGENELLTGVHLRLKQGVRYGLVGRNGSGKSTLLTAVADKLIPGIGAGIRILLLSQVEDSERASKEEQAAGGQGRTVSVLEHVVRGDKERLRATEMVEALTKCLESPSLQQTQLVVHQVQLSQLRLSLVEAQKTASRRSGQRGKDARDEEIRLEKEVKDAEERVTEDEAGNTEPDPEIAKVAMDLLSEAQLTLELLDSATTESRASSILTGLGFTQEMMDSPYSTLSGGWRSRCSLAVSLLVKCDLLLLDEPTNFLDLEAIIWLEHFLSSSPTTAEQTLVLISHDQEFLNNTVEETIVLRHKGLKYFEGTPRAFEIEERKERRRKGRQVEALEKKREHIEKSIQSGMASAKKTGDENRQRMVKSRQKKLDERWGAEVSAKGTRFKLNRDMVGFFNTNRLGVEMEQLESRIRISIPQPSKLRTLGDLIHFENVEYRFPPKRKGGKPGDVFLKGVSFTVDQGGKLALIGANGQGKSTIAKLILGTLQPSSGTITRHPLLTIGYFSQHSVEELSSLPLLSNLSLEDGTRAPTTALSHFVQHFEEKGEKVTEQEARACLGSFGLQGKIASETPLGKLSGGQKVRLALALLVFHPPALLLLDEVTTHVDAPTIESLAKALKNYEGGIILVTHDRYFSRIVVEGSSPRQILAEADDGTPDEDSGSDSSIDEDDSGEGKKPPGQTWRVGAGTIKKMDKGMAQYVGIVERKLEKRRKAEGL